MIPVLEPVLKGNELKYVTDCIESGWISSKGEYVKKFENGLSEIIGNPYVVSVANGTVALSLALSALDIGPGDEVIVPDFTFAATINSVLHVGATPVIVDVNLDDWNICLKSIRASITNKTKAIMPVHLYGYPAHMSEILKIANEFGLFVIEDCAEALGSTHMGTHVGNFGDAGTFSFFGNKLITTGEGGAVSFKSKEVYEKALILRDHGMNQTRRYWHEVVGFNYRITNLQAAVGLAQIERFRDIVEAKRNIYDRYNLSFLNHACFEKRTLFSGDTEGYWLYTLRLSTDKISRDDFIKKMTALGIETRPGFFPLHAMPPYKSYASNNFENSRMLSGNILSLPSGGGLTPSQQNYIIEEIEKVLSSL